MADRQISETAKHLIAAKAKIADPKNWQQFDHGWDGGPMCANGALHRVGARMMGPAYMALKHAALDLHGMRAWQVNDQLGHAAIMKVFDKAIEVELRKGKQ